jgi:hypothetical protein
MPAFKVGILIWKEWTSATFVMKEHTKTTVGSLYARNALMGPSAHGERQHALAVHLDLTGKIADARLAKLVLLQLVLEHPAVIDALKTRGVRRGVQNANHARHGLKVQGALI